jgi:Domain of unknown function (DUF4034)
MKKCSYCGAEYPDDAVMCAVDQTPLDNPPPSPPALGKGHSGIGVASFVISIVVGCFMMATLCLAAILAAHRIPGGRTYPGQLVVGLAIIFLAGVDVVAIALGIAAVCQTARNRLFGILGLVFSSLTIVGVIGFMIFGLAYMRSKAGVHETSSNQFNAPSAALPFQITTVWPDDESKEMFGRNRLANNLIEATNYDKLDELAGTFRSSKECYANGAWKLNDIYAGLVPSDKASDDEWQNRIAALQDWADAKPDSITARVSLANVLVNFAWKARGSGWANTVSDEGWQSFGNRLHQAMKVLNAAENIKAQCPYSWTVRMRAALGLQMDKDQFNDIFQQAINHDSDYEPSYLQRAVYLMPRWYGGDGELEADLERSANQMGGDDGDMLYAQVVWGLHARASSPNVIEENHFLWPRIDKGFAVIEKRFSNSLAAKSERACLAAYAGDVGKTREYLAQTQGKADLVVWRTQDEYLRIANWAYSK